MKKRKKVILLIVSIIIAIMGIVYIFNSNNKIKNKTLLKNELDEKKEISNTVKQDKIGSQNKIKEEVEKKEKLKQEEKSNSNKEKVEKNIQLTCTKSLSAIPVIYLDNMGVLKNLGIKLQIIEDSSIKNRSDFYLTNIPELVKMNNMGIKIKLLNISRLMDIKFYSTKDITSFYELNGETIYVKENSEEEVLTRLFLTESGIDLTNVKFKYIKNSSDLSSNSVSNIVLSDRNYMKLSKELKEIFDYNNEWKTIFGDNSEIIGGGLAVSSEFLLNNKQIVDELKKEYNLALKNISEDEFKKIAKKLGFDNVSFRKYISLNVGEVVEDYCRVILDYKPELIGGKLPDKDFYYEK